MIFFNSLALIGVAGIALPILIHIFARHRAVRVPFPTLRFIAPARAAAMRRRALEDLPLLLVRASIVLAAAAAVAGPFLATMARRHAWEATTVTAEVTDVPAGTGAAIAWLNSQGPGKRELVFRSRFALGSLSGADVAAIPRHIGLRFERTGPLEGRRDVAAPAAISGSATAPPRRIERIVTLDADRTSVRDAAEATASALPVEIATTPADRAAADAMLASALLDRIPAAERSHRVRIELPDGRAPYTPLRAAWMGDAAAQIVRTLNGRVAGLRFAADGDVLVAAAGIAVHDAEAPLLLRAALTALAPSSSATDYEVVAITDRQLREWTRPAGRAVVPPEAPVARDDRRWLWLIVLGLIVVETRIRRDARTAIAESPAVDERSRVA